MNDLEIPLVLHILSIMGLCMLAISVIIFVVYMALFNQARDTNVTATRLNIPLEENALMISYIVIGALGFFFCLAIPYAHNLKSKNDPSVISSKNGLHFERFNVGANKIEAVDIVKPSKYKLENDNKNINSFNINDYGIEKFL